MTFSCNTDDVIEQITEEKPVIILDSSTGIYDVIQGETLVISPDYINITDARYQWEIDGVVVADTPSLTYKWDETGEFYVTITVVCKNGTVQEELKVIVTEPALPVISLPLSNDNIDVLIGNDFVITPEIKNRNDSEFKIKWEVNSKVVSEELKFIFHAENTGDYNISVTATNSFGSDSRSFMIHVVEELPINITFPTISYFNKSTTRYTFANRPIYITPIISRLESTTINWLVDGMKVDCISSTYVFTPSVPGDFDITVLVDDKYSATMKVVCVDATEEQRMRSASSSANNNATKVFEYCPAPGQFIGDTNVGGMTGLETTLDAANEWALNRLKNNNYVSLGGFGGYIIVGFDHSIKNNNGSFDFSIMGNAFFNAQSGTGGSNEPGIIYVMQDVNGNGLPDDEWYELRGSNTGIDGTLQNYAITYYKPAGDNMSVQWTDNIGNSGMIDYLSSFHRQPSYYPAWIGDASYTLYGTRLEARNTQDSQTGMWDNWAFDWGYADNMGSDLISSGSEASGEGQSNGFMISNAMYPDFTNIPLQYIDFIKVQTGVCAKSGHLGELSTEVFGFIDL
ncbi:MAG: cell surface protein [Paramuribaculum sp.]|nr:cell surface protein [Paramuribaculum sp.]